MTRARLIYRRKPPREATQLPSTDELVTVDCGKGPLTVRFHHENNYLSVFGMEIAFGMSYIHEFTIEVPG